MIQYSHRLCVSRICSTIQVFWISQPGMDRAGKRQRFLWLDIM